MKLPMLATLLLLAGTARADCPNFAQIGDLAFSYASRTPVRALPDMQTLTDAYCAQGKLAATLGRQKGVQAGYRATWTSEDARRGSGADRPGRGILFTDMFLHDDARVPVGYASVPRVTADFVAVVADDDIQKATTALDVLRHIAYFVPVIDLSDTLLENGREPTPIEAVAANFGTRYAVVGTPIPVEPTEEFLERLARIEVIMTDSEGRTVGRGRTGDLLGNPVQALMWLARDLEYNAQRIQSGDRLALGTLFRTDAPRPGDAWTASYTAPDIAAQVSVSFTSDLDRSQADAEALEPPALPAFVHRLVDND